MLVLYTVPAAHPSSAPPGELGARGPTSTIKAESGSPSKVLKSAKVRSAIPGSGKPPRFTLQSTLAIREPARGNAALALRLRLNADRTDLPATSIVQLGHAGERHWRWSKMEVRRWMKHPVHCVKPLDSIQHARDLMGKNRVNQLPVVVDGRLAGIVTDRDLRDAFPSVFDSDLFGRRKRQVATSDPRSVTVEMVMSPTVMSLGPGDPMADAVRLMRRQRIGALPVVEGERVIGILTRSDVLDAFVDLVEIDASRETSIFDETSVPEKPKSKPRKPASRTARRR